MECEKTQTVNGFTITFPKKYSAVPQTLQFYLNRLFLKLAQKPTKFTEGEIKLPSWSSHKVRTESEFPSQRMKKSKRQPTPAQTWNSKSSWNTLTSQIMLKICCSGDFHPANNSKGLQQKERKHRFLAATQDLHSRSPSPCLQWRALEDNQATINLYMEKHPHLLFQN